MKNAECGPALYIQTLIQEFEQLLLRSTGPGTAILEGARFPTFAALNVGPQSLMDL